MIELYTVKTYDFKIKIFFRRGGQILTGYWLKFQANRSPAAGSLEV